MINTSVRYPRVFQWPIISAVVMTLWLGLGLGLGLEPPAATAQTGAALAEGFRTPPISARPGAFWNWLNGHVDRDRLLYDLREMKDKGMSGAEIWDVAAIRNSDRVPAGPEFLGAESAATIRYALSEGRKLGLRMGMITSSGWNAGGSWVDPSWASKLLVASSIEATGSMTFDGVLPFPEVPKDCPKDANGRPRFAIDIAVLAVPDHPRKTIADPDAVIDLTDKLASDGRLRWEVPAGQWRIFRFVCTNTGQHLIVPSPKSNGLFIDFLDPAATRRHLQVIMDRLHITPANAEESGLDYLEVDSMELHEGNPWTDHFAKWFREHCGYDPVQWLPVLAGWTVGDGDLSARFLYDYRKTVSDLLIHSHYETGRKFLDAYGIEFVGESGGPGPPVWDTCPVDALKALGNMHVPRGEFWIQHRNMFLIKEIASAAHTYGLPIVDAEAFTTWRRWMDSPFVLKLAADRAFAEGLNRLTIHCFAHSPEGAGLPGFAYHAGIDINPNTTWWRYARPFMDYMARCSYMLQQGLPVADVLWYYGDQAPNFFPAHHNVPEKPRLPGLSAGYDYDVVNSDVILNRLQVRDGRFVLPEGTSYAVLSFPESAAMPLEVMEKLETFVKAGAVVSGIPPADTPGLLNHEERREKLREITSRMWGDNPTTGARSYGEGRVYCGKSLDDVLTSEEVDPDFTVVDAESANAVDYIHRRTTEADIYFIRNTAMKPQKARLRFRGEDRSPGLWDPGTGKARRCDAVACEGGFTEIDVSLPSGGTVFAVLGSEMAGKGKATPRMQVREYDLELRGPWLIAFPDGWGAPTSATLAKLKCWTSFEDPGVQCFSGTAEYRCEFDADPQWLTGDGEVNLDLGGVGDVAEVELNGVSAGVAWKPPYRVNVSDLVRPKGNRLAIRVTNQWHNRLVGDARADEGERFCKTNLPLPPKDENLLPSGLLGPVKVVVEAD